MEPKWPWRSMFECFGVGAIVVMAVMFCFLASGKVHADCLSPYCMHESSIRPKTVDVSPEPAVEVDRSIVSYGEDKSVLIATAHARHAEAMPIPVVAVKEKPQEMVVTSVVDDGKLQ